MSLPIIEDLLTKYENNEYITKILINKINNLPKILEEANFIYEQKKKKYELLKKEQEIFINLFLSNNHYYYLSNQNKYYEYNGTSYFCVEEDEIIIKILSMLSKNTLLIRYKYKTKIMIIKKIKEKCLLHSIPETTTIQNILQFLCPFLFSTENEAKYFLTVLGNILLKNNEIYFLISSDTKKIINTIDVFINKIMGSCFLYKYFFTKMNATRSKSEYRLLNMNIINIELLKTNLKNVCLDLLCVSSFYSKMYQSSDIFLEKYGDEYLQHYSLLLKQNTEEDIVNYFINRNIEKNETHKISWNNIHYIWKRYLDKNNYPILMTSNQFKEILKSKIEYNEETDIFQGITSKYLPYINDFLHFWDNSIIDSDNNLEIEEFKQIYKCWYNKNNYANSIKEIISHFYPNIIIDNKYIYNVDCSLWNKKTEINKVFNLYKIEFKTKVLNKEIMLPYLIPLHEIYHYYMEHITELNKEFDIIINKKYFIQYLINNNQKYIKYDKFMSGDFINE
jgi:hypothetical protein